MRSLYSALLLVFLALCSKCSAEKAWSEGRYPYEDASTEIPFKKEIDNFSSTEKLKVNIRNSYPLFQNDSLFIQEVNRHLHNNAKETVCSFIQQFAEEELKDEEFDEEAISMDFDKREISYVLRPIYASSRLVSVFGILYSYSGMPHGSTRYYAFNYCGDGKQMHEITQENLFLPNKDFANFIIQYCLSTLEKE